MNVLCPVAKPALSARRGKVKEPSRFLHFLLNFSSFFPDFLNFFPDLNPLFLPIFGKLVAVKENTLPPLPSGVSGGGCFGCWSTPHTRPRKKKEEEKKRKKRKERKKRRKRRKERKPMITKNIWAPPYPPLNGFKVSRHGSIRQTC